MRVDRRLVQSNVLRRDHPGGPPPGFELAVECLCLPAGGELVGVVRPERFGQVECRATAWQLEVLPGSSIRGAIGHPLGRNRGPEGKKDEKQEKGGKAARERESEEETQKLHAEHGMTHGKHPQTGFESTRDKVGGCRTWLVT